MSVYNWYRLCDMIKSPYNRKDEYQESCRSFMILSLFLSIPVICCLLIPYSVPFSDHLWKEWIDFVLRIR